MNKQNDGFGCRLIVDCPDKRGVVAKVSTSLSNLGATILEAHQHSDVASGHFFMRYEVARDAATSPEAWGAGFLLEGLSDVRDEVRVECSCFVDGGTTQGGSFGNESVALSCRCAPALEKRRASLRHHLCHRKSSGNGGIRRLYKVPFHHVDFTHQPKAAAFQEVDRLLDDHQVDLTVLARFMQIIPAPMIAKHHGRMINIHHSFLPSFVGARPYDQAFERGVKLIGATCHYVTEELDEGPIIEQEVIRVSHTDTPADLRRKGRMCEREALGRGLRLHLEGRIFIHGNKTVVFSD